MKLLNKAKNHTTNALRLCVALLTFSTVAQAASVNVVHGIDGRSLGADKALPVDIAVNGACALKGVRFTQSSLVELKAGTYKITVHLANGSCSNAAVITQNVTIAEGSYSLVASLTRAGTPQLAAFHNSKDLGFTPVVATRHLAAAGAVSVEYRISDLPRPQTQRISNGKFSSLSILGARFRYTATIFAGSKRNTLAKLTGTARRSYVIYNIVGSKSVGFTVIPETLVP